MISEEVEPRKKKPKKTILEPPTFSSLPDEITENILARVSRWNYPWLSLVSKRFRSLLSSMELYKTRSQLGGNETCLYVCLGPPNDPYPSWFSLWPKRNPIQTRTKGRGKLKFKQSSSGNILVPIPSSSSSPPIPATSTVEVGSEIYVIGSYGAPPSSSVRIFDCRSHTWREAPNMTVARKVPCAVLLDEKIYVMGGIDKECANWFEVFDIKTQSWTALPIHDDGLRDRITDHYEIACVVQGKIYVMADTKVYTYEPRQGTWKAAREKRSKFINAWCVIENAIYCCCEDGCCLWYDFKGRKWKRIKGLKYLREHGRKGLMIDSVRDMVNYGGKLLVFWDPYHGTKRSKHKIWYAKISLETRCSGSEVWGMVEWVDVLLTAPRDSCESLLCFTVSV